MALALSPSQYITGTGIATEGAWEDSLPSRYCAYEPNGGLWASIIRFPFECRDVNAIARGWYSHLALNMAETDTETKHRRMVDILQKADILTVSSNRFYDALPRVKRRFAMSSDYYDRLFGGKLEYTMLKEFSRFPTILGIGIQDQYLTSTLPRWLNEMRPKSVHSLRSPDGYVSAMWLTGADLSADFATLRSPAAHSAPSTSPRCRRRRSNWPARHPRIATWYELSSYGVWGLWRWGGCLTR
jgi:hypothetical protein